MDRENRRRRARNLARSLRNMMQDLTSMRISHGQSQEDIANLLGVTQPAIAKLERYDANPTLSTVRRYALAVGAELEIKVSDAGVMHRTLHSEAVQIPGEQFTADTSSAPDDDVTWVLRGAELTSV